MYCECYRSSNVTGNNINYLKVGLHYYFLISECCVCKIELFGGHLNTSQIKTSQNRKWKIGFRSSHFFFIYILKIFYNYYHDQLSQSQMFFQLSSFTIYLATLFGFPSLHSPLQPLLHHHKWPKHIFQTFLLIFHPKLAHQHTHTRTTTTTTTNTNHSTKGTHQILYIYRHIYVHYSSHVLHTDTL